MGQGQAQQGGLSPLLDAEFPRFSPAEMARRRSALVALCRSEGLDAILVCGENRAGSGVGWLTGWSTTAEAVALFDPARAGVLFVQYHNHVPLARRIASEWDVRWGGSSTVAAVKAELEKRHARRVGILGPWATAKQRALGDCVDLNAAYTKLRLIKSQEELEWIRVGARLSDLAIDAIRRHARAGTSERELWRLCEDAYVGAGGTTWIHYFGATAMAAPDCCVPRQYPLNRVLQPGDVLFCEISAQLGEYPGQVLRSFTVDAEPTPLYRALYAAADAALEAILKKIRKGTTASELIAASRVIEDAGFTTCDDLVHGFVGGYLPPVLGSASRPAGPVPALELEAGMTLVVQPNVVTRDALAGVQVGELVAVTESGFERLHGAPREFFRL